jgi:hypothetical protein
MNSGLSIPRAGADSLRLDRNAAQRAAKVAAILGLDDLKTQGNAIHMCGPPAKAGLRRSCGNSDTEDFQPNGRGRSSFNYEPTEGRIKSAILPQSN